MKHFLEAELAIELKNSSSPNKAAEKEEEEEEKRKYVWCSCSNF